MQKSSYYLSTVTVSWVWRCSRKITGIILANLDLRCIENVLAEGNVKPSYFEMIYGI